MRGRRLAVAAAAAGLVVAGLGAPDAALARDARKPLILVAFVQAGRTDVLRNEVLEFRFSAPLAPRSVDERTLRVLETTPTGGAPVVGARIVRGRRVLFDPTRTQRNYDASLLPNSVYVEKDRCEGFDGPRDFEIRIPAAPLDGWTLRDRHGRPNVRPFSTTFRTSALYEDPVPGRPFFIGDHGTGLLGFDPPRGGLSGLAVDADATMVVEFNEPVALETLQANLVVTRTTGERVTGVVRRDPAACARYLFQPVGGFASGTNIRVQILGGVTDLVGNPLLRTFPSTNKVASAFPIR